MAVLPIRARCRYLSQIDFRVKIRGKRIAVIAAVAVQNINRINSIKKMFFGISTIGLGHARVKAAAEQCGQSGLFKPFLISPLPGIVKIS